MTVFDSFSKRQKRLRGEAPDVFLYHELPAQLRGQILHIVKDVFGVNRNYSSGLTQEAYKTVHDILCRELGVFELVAYSDSAQDAIFSYFQQEKSVELALDVIELLFRYIEFTVRKNSQFKAGTTRRLEPNAAIAELNIRFKEHGVGYRFESGEIIRIDSEFLHAEAVKPTLLVLSDKEFEGANEEFLNAHEHYQHGRHKECLVDALKAFESTMMTICNLRGWKTQPTDTAKTLINTCMTNGLFPSYFDNQFTSIRILLESGVPTVRNKNGGHGQGAEPIEVPEYLARYALNLTATTILLMVEAHQATK